MLVSVVLIVVIAVGCTATGPTTSSTPSTTASAITSPSVGNSPSISASSDPTASVSASAAPTASDDAAVSNSNALTLEASVSAAIISYNKPHFMGGENQAFATEVHETIKTVEQGNTVTVYVVADYMQYSFTNGEPKLTGGSGVPAALTFSKDSNGVYILTEYWEAPDGSNAQTIQVKFPADAAEKAYQLMSTGMSDGKDVSSVCYQRAKDYFASTTTVPSSNT